MSDDHFQRWTDAMVASYERDRQAILAKTPKYTGTTVPPASCRGVDEWPDWMLYDKLDADVAAYIVELRSRDELEASEVRELKKWRNVGDDDITCPEDAEQALSEVDDLRAEMDDLKANAEADDAHVIELRGALQNLLPWFEPLDDEDGRAAADFIRSTLEKTAPADDEDDDTTPEAAHAEDRVRADETLAGKPAGGSAG